MTIHIKIKKKVQKSKIYQPCLSVYLSIAGYDIIKNKSWPNSTEVFTSVPM